MTYNFGKALKDFVEAAALIAILVDLEATWTIAVNLLRGKILISSDKSVQFDYVVVWTFFTVVASLTALLQIWDIFWETFGHHIKWDIFKRCRRFPIRWEFLIVNLCERLPQAVILLTILVQHNKALRTPYPLAADSLQAVMAELVAANSRFARSLPRLFKMCGDGVKDLTSDGSDADDEEVAGAECRLTCWRCCGDGKVSYRPEFYENKVVQAEVCNNHQNDAEVVDEVVVQNQTDDVPQITVTKQENIDACGSRQEECGGSKMLDLAFNFQTRLQGNERNERKVLKAAVVQTETEAVPEIAIVTRQMNEGDGEKASRTLRVSRVKDLDVVDRPQRSVVLQSREPEITVVTFKKGSTFRNIATQTTSEQIQQTHDTPQIKVVTKHLGYTADAAIVKVRDSRCGRPMALLLLLLNGVLFVALIVSSMAYIGIKENQANVANQTAS